MSQGYLNEAEALVRQGEDTAFGHLRGMIDLWGEENVFALR